MGGFNVGWIFLGLLGLIVLLLLAPAVVYAAYRDGAFTLRVRVLFVKITLLPAKPRRAKKTKPKTDKKRQTKPAKEKEKKSAEDIVLLVKRIAAGVGAGGKLLLRFVFIRDVQLFMPVSGQDAAEVALNCGRTQALVGAARAAVMNVVHLQCTRLVIAPDFAGQYGKRLYFSCKAVASPVIMVVAGVVGFVRFFRYRPLAYTKADYLRANPKARGFAREVALAEKALKDKEK